MAALDDDLEQRMRKVIAEARLDIIKVVITVGGLIIAAMGTCTGILIAVLS